MSFKKNILSLSLAALIPTASFGGAAPLSQSLKVLKGPCDAAHPSQKVLKPADNIGAIDYNLHRWAAFLTDNEKAISKDKNACKDFLKYAGQENRLQKLHDSVKSARLPMNADGSGHTLMGMGAVTNGLKRLGLENCSKAISKAANLVQEKEARLKKYCGS